MMRTTLNIDDEVLREAKHEAVERQISLGELVSWALRVALRAPGSDEGPFRMVVYGPTSPVVSHQPADFHAAVEADDETTLRR